MKSIKIALLTAPLWFNCSVALAADEQDGIKGFFDMDMHVQGSDELVTFYKSDGSDSTLSAGQGISIRGGAQIPITSPIYMEVSGGWKQGSVSASNGEATFTRYSVEALALFRQPVESGAEHQLAAGILYHTAPKFKCDITGICDGSVSFDAATGFALQYRFALGAMPNKGGRMILGARYESIKYGASVGSDIDGSNFALSIGFSQ